MGRSTFSQDSVGSSGFREFEDLRFSYAFCYCKKTAMLRIVTSQGKPSRGKLYFICERKECSFFKWCEPNRNVQAPACSSSTAACSSSTAVGGADFEDLALNLTEIKDKIQKLVNILSYGLFFVVVVVALICRFK